jgi:uncharacterized protein
MLRGDVFHPGEIAVQVRAGQREIAAARESLIRPRLSHAANVFVETQDIVAVAATAPDGTLWASLWCVQVGRELDDVRGTRGFLHGDDDGGSLTILYDLDVHASDPVRPIVRPNEPLGLLVIDLETRRRLRINGIVRRADRAGLEVDIREALVNCPKYIQKRVRAGAVPDASASGAGAAVEHGWTLDEEMRGLIARTDTLFVASAHGDRGLDVSHRGGDPGFVRVVDHRTLRIPDYPGNSLFQTLGNFEVDRRCGLAFVDFERSRILAATGHALSEFGSEDPTHPAGGTGRYWSFTVDRWIEFSLSSSARWTLVERSAFNPT